MPSGWQYGAWDGGRGGWREGVMGVEYSGTESYISHRPPLPPLPGVALRHCIYGLGSNSVSRLEVNPNEDKCYSPSSLVNLSETTCVV